MSGYCVQFKLDRNTIVLDRPHFICGGTYAVGGTRNAELNITYNYAGYFRELFRGGIRGLYGTPAAELRSQLEYALHRLEHEKFPVSPKPCHCHGLDSCYWAINEKNAANALRDLHKLAKMVPEEAVLAGD